MRNCLLGVLFLFLLPSAFAETYQLDIAYKKVNISGRAVRKITVNGGIPGPTLYFTEGEEAVIHVTNHLDEDTSVHWHGLLLPGSMDGVPGLNGFKGIKPGETFTYRFQLRQSGTYWYHAHSLGQEQDGHYGALVIHPREKDEIESERDYVVLLSDYTEESWKEVLSNLKMSAHYYNYNQLTVMDFFRSIGENGIIEALRFVRDWGEMRMSPTDLSDVSGYTFLINGKTPSENWTAIFNSGERVRLRFINASAMSIYDVRIPGLKLKVVQADGQNVEPVLVDEFRFGVAETYDVIVEPERKPYTIVAEPIDRTGFALATVSPEPGLRGEIPAPRKRAQLTMSDMGMGHDHHGHAMEGDHSEHQEQGHSAHAMGEMFEKSGWAQAGTPEGHGALKYSDLRILGTQADTRPASRELEVVLGGNMERYIWTLNGKRHQESGPMYFAFRERVRLTLVNTTMMAHPMHLHGMFVQLDNGQPADKMPQKHTIIVPPGQSTSVFLTADEPGEWAFHCHLLYHMLSGMMTTVVVSDTEHTNAPVGKEKIEENHHVH